MIIFGKRNKIFRTIKKRYNRVIDRNLENQWNLILRFINLDRKIKYDNKYNYFIYL